MSNTPDPLAARRAQAVAKVARDLPHPATDGDLILAFTHAYDQGALDGFDRAVDILAERKPVFIESVEGAA